MKIVAMTWGGLAQEGDQKYPELIHYRSGGYFVFSIKSEPKVIFKLARPRSTPTEVRFSNILLGQKIIREHTLDCLVIPKSCLLQIGKIEVIAQEKLLFNDNRSVQEEMYETNALLLEKPLTQLAHFVCHSGLHDIAWRNIPILNLGSEGSPPKIGLIDLEEMQFAWSGFYGNPYDKFRRDRGLIGCCPSDEGSSDDEQVTIVLKKAIEQIVARINDWITKKAKKRRLTLREKRCVSLNYIRRDKKFSGLDRIYSPLPKPYASSEASTSSNSPDEEKSWDRRILELLVEEGYLFRFYKAPNGDQFAQA